MSRESEHEESILHRYFDGELESEETAEVRRLLSARADLRMDLERMGEIRSLLRESVEKSAAELDSDDLFARIEARIDRDGEEPKRDVRPRLVAIEGGKRTRRVAAVVLGAVAIAAAVLLFVIRPTESSGVLDDSIAVHSGDASESVATVETVFQTEVIEVDFGDNSGAIFAIEGEHGERHAVVWLADVQPTEGIVE